MNLLETYLCVSGATFSIYEWLIIKNNLKELKRAKENLKYKENLSEESKKEKVKAHKCLMKNIGMLNAVGAGFALTPMNVAVVPYLIKNQEVLNMDTYEKLKEKYEKINKIEKSKIKTKKLINKEINK